MTGYEHYFDVAQVEVYLVRQGFVFSKDLTTVRLPQKTQRESHIVPDAFDAEPMSVDPEPDDWMQHDMLFTDEWVENARNFIMQDFGADTESWAFGDLDARCSEPEGRHDTDDLPFGLREQSSEEPLPACGVQLDPALCGGEFCGVDSDDDGSYESDEQDHSGLEAASEVSVAALVRRLAVICICVGEAGPGFAPEDVDKVIMDLSDPD